MIAPWCSTLFDLGYRAVQARRDPKNENTDMALLDGLSETINNFIYRQGNIALGLPAPLNGSGMMFEYVLYKDIMRNMDSIGGFDRELELRLLQRDVMVYFAQNIIVYDEKGANRAVFEHQRKRWISSHFFYLRKYFREGWSELWKGNFAFFNSAVLRNIQLPRLLNLGLLAVTLSLSLIFQSYLTLNPLVWVLLLSVNLLAMVFAIPRRFYTTKLLKSLVLIPRLFIRMFFLLFRLKGANKTFIHTPHSRVEMSVENKTAN
jgi:cellulose synthase/poly-beta-1,6-N-acetylglucosamine synthase-like glycosyltransferase